MNLLHKCRSLRYAADTGLETLTCLLSASHKPADVHVGNRSVAAVSKLSVAAWLTKYRGLVTRNSECWPLADQEAQPKICPRDYGCRKRACLLGSRADRCRFGTACVDDDRPKRSFDRPLYQAGEHRPVFETYQALLYPFFVLRTARLSAKLVPYYT